MISARIGVVLSSGGGRSIFAHTGFMLALQSMGIEISAIAGVWERDYWTPDSWPLDAVAN